MTDPLPVSVSGFTWTSLFSGGSMLALFGLLIKQVGPWRRQTMDAEMQLRSEMSETIRSQQVKIEGLEHRIENNRKQYEAERSLDRHKINNLSQLMDTIFLMLEATPERVTEVVQKMREMRTRQLEAEAVESATLRAEAARPKGEAI